MFLANSDLSQALDIFVTEFPLGLWETFYSTALATLFAVIIGLPLGVLLVVGDKDGILPLPKPIMVVLNWIINIFRSIPFLILMILVIPVTKFIVGTNVGTVATIVPLVIAAFPFIARLVESSLREISPSLIETALSMGANPIQIIIKVYIKESIPSLISNLTIAITTILSYTAMSGVLGGGGLGKIAISYGYYRFNTLVMLLAVIVFIVFMEGAQRKIPVQYANRPAAASFSGRSDSNIPIKLNSASVIPVIFASTLMSLPAVVIQVLDLDPQTGAGYWLNQIFTTTSNDAGNVTINSIGFALYILLIVVFSFFYSFLQLSPDKMSENLQKQNAYVPGVRPGEETTGYISRVLFKITVVGATYLAIVAILPILMTVLFDLPSSAQIGGTSLIIVVGVAIESWNQIKQANQEKQYRGFIG